MTVTQCYWMSTINDGSRCYTLNVHKDPGGQGGPVEIIVGETSPVVDQQADENVDDHHGRHSDDIVQGKVERGLSGVSGLSGGRWHGGGRSVPARVGAPIAH